MVRRRDEDFDLADYQRHGRTKPSERERDRDPQRR